MEELNRDLQREVFFRSEMTVDKAHLKRTYPALKTLKRVRWLLTLLPLVCLLYSGHVMLTKGDLPLGIPIMAGIFLLFALMLPSLLLSQLMSQYRQYKADGRRVVTLLSNGVETELTKYGNTVFSDYSAFKELTEDEDFWYLVAGNQKVLIPKSPVLEGDAETVRAFLETKLVPCNTDE